MKYVLFTSADQTWVYMDKTGDYTVVCAEAEVYDSTMMAIEKCRKWYPNATIGMMGPTAREDWLIEPIEDLEEFQAREDTW